MSEESVTPVMRSGLGDMLFFVSFLFTVVMFIMIFSKNFWGAVIAGVIQSVIPVSIFLYEAKKR